MMVDGNWGQVTMTTNCTSKLDGNGNEVIGATCPVGAPAASVCAGGKVYSGGTQLGVGGGLSPTTFSGNPNSLAVDCPATSGLPLAIGPDTTTGNYWGRSTTAGGILEIIDHTGAPVSVFNQIVEAGGSAQTQRAKLNFALGSNVSITPSDSGSDTNTITIDATPASGGGGPTFTPGYCLWWPFGPQWNAGSAYAGFGAKVVQVWQITVPYAMTIGKIDPWIKTASGTGCTGGTCGLVFGIYSADSTCSTRLGSTTPLVSGGTPDINSTTALVTATCSSPVSLSAGVYLFTMVSDSSVLVLQGIQWGVESFEDLNGARRGTFTSNPITGNGPSLALPSNCSNRITVNNGARPPLVAFER